MKKSSKVAILTQIKKTKEAVSDNGDANGQLEKLQTQLDEQQKSTFDNTTQEELEQSKLHSREEEDDG